MENISNYPNDEQKSIIDAVTNSKEQTILVNACPGSYMEELLVYRLQMLPKKKLKKIMEIFFLISILLERLIHLFILT